MLVLLVDSFFKKELSPRKAKLLGATIGLCALFLALSLLCLIIFASICKRALERLGLLKDSLRRFKPV